MYGAIRNHRWYVDLKRSPIFPSCRVDRRVPPNHTELLVNVVDVVLNGSGIDEKFLGVTLFALVPNTTEFMNAMSFAMNGNIALRYVFDVASKKHFGVLSVGAVWRSVLHTPFRCAFYRSPRWSPFRHGTIQPRWVKWPIPSRESFALATIQNMAPYPEHTCPDTRLIFPRWDVIVIILSIFLLTYTYIEAKANYHRGSILVLRFVFLFLPSII